MQASSLSARPGLMHQYDSVCAAPCLLRRNLFKWCDVQMCKTTASTKMLLTIFLESLYDARARDSTKIPTPELAGP